MSALAWVLVACAAPLVQDAEATGTEQDVQAALAELRRHSAELGPFRARYQVEGTEDDKTIDFEYLPQGRLHCVMTSPSGAMASWVDGSRVCGLMEGDGQTYWASFDAAEPPVAMPQWHTLLDERFPSARSDQSYRPWITCLWDLNQETDRVEFTLGVGSLPPGEDDALLGWLRVLEHDSSSLRVNEDSVVQEHPRYRATVSRKTGFLESLDMLSAEGKKASLRLVSLELDLEVLPAFEPVERPDGAQDISTEFARSLIALVTHDARGTALKRVDRLIAERAIDWTSARREDWREVLRAIHAPEVQATAESYLPQLDEWTASLFDGFAQRAGAGAPRESLRAEIESSRVKLSEVTAEGLEKLAAEWTPAPAQPGESEVWDELLELEARVLDELLEEHVVKPALAEFDAAAEAFLRG